MAKATRRDLRRAVGVAAVGTIQQLDVAVGSLGHGLNHLRGDVAELARDHATFKQHTTAALSVHDAVCKGHDAVLYRPFLGRLRWLLTGR